MRLLTTTGEDMPSPIFTSQSCLSDLGQVFGTATPTVEPSRFGPRHWGQSASSAQAPAATARNAIAGLSILFDYDCQTQFSRWRFSRIWREWRAWQALGDPADVIRVK